LDDDFGQDLIHDIVPLIDNTYRTITDPDHRAIAGLSMGGSQAIREGILHPELFHYIGIFSVSPTNPAAFENKYGTAIDQAAPQLKLVYYALGKTDGIFKDPNSPLTKSVSLDSV
jgi:enterochelin esterase-like enzyme